MFIIFVIERIADGYYNHYIRHDVHEVMAISLFRSTDYDRTNITTATAVRIATMFLQYDDVIMSAIDVSNQQPHDCLLNRLFKAQIKENIKAPLCLPLCGEFTDDRWIPRTKGH